ncbi:MAG: zinc ribbon domain-containing protein [Fervidicoccaceae archaeon]
MKCNSKLVESGYRKLKCLKCGFEADRDLIGASNIRERQSPR